MFESSYSGGIADMRRLDRSVAQRGFTLVELLVVMVILGLLASLVLPNFLGQVGGARKKTALVQMRTLGTALDAYALDTGSYPSTSQGLAALVEKPSGQAMWDGPYLKGKIPNDPWGKAYEYVGPGDSGSGSASYEIVCLGADGRRGGADDNEDISSSQ
jgi:general secretion pathway protein G